MRMTTSSTPSRSTSVTTTFSIESLPEVDPAPPRTSVVLPLGQSKPGQDGMRTVALQSWIAAADAASQSPLAAGTGRGEGTGAALTGTDGGTEITGFDELTEAARSEVAEAQPAS